MPFNWPSSNETAHCGRFKIETVIAERPQRSTEGINVATKLISQDKVQAIVGPGHHPSDCGRIGGINTARRLS
jgi:hypothetical protein